MQKLSFRMLQLQMRSRELKINLRKLKLQSRVLCFGMQELTLQTRKLYFGMLQFKMRKQEFKNRKAELWIKIAVPRLPMPWIKKLLLTCQPCYVQWLFTPNQKLWIFEVDNFVQKPQHKERTIHHEDRLFSCVGVTGFEPTTLAPGRHATPRKIFIKFSLSSAFLSMPPMLFIFCLLPWFLLCSSPSSVFRVWYRIDMRWIGECCDFWILTHRHRLY